MHYWTAEDALADIVERLACAQHAFRCANNQGVLCTAQFVLGIQPTFGSSALEHIMEVAAG
jgi:hypothetical protein